MILIIVALLLILKGIFNLDLFPGLTAYLAVKKSPENVIFWSAFSGFFKDALFFPGFINFLNHTLLGGLALWLKNYFIFEDDRLIYTLAFILAPASVVFTAVGLRYFQNAEISNFVFALLSVTLTNLIFIWFLDFIFRRNR